jgi:serine/threonine protein phosphatase PrpC
MGDYLSTPNKAKHSDEGSNNTLMFGASSMQGWRKSNEDAHIAQTDFEPGFSLFAVFDGHGGCEVAKYCERHFIQELKNDDSYKAQDYEQALKNVFVKIDKMLLSPAGKKELDKIGRN